MHKIVHSLCKESFPARGDKDITRSEIASIIMAYLKERKNMIVNRRKNNEMPMPM